MRIVSVSTEDITGGAARCAFSVHEGLRRLGHDVEMVVARRRSNDPEVTVAKLEAASRLRRFGDRLIRRWPGFQVSSIPDWVEAFNTDRSPYRGLRNRLPLHDVVHLHWVAGLVDIPTFLAERGRKIPVVWTLHDMNLLTGGCHYSLGCDRFTASCGRCPQLESTRTSDISRRVILRKQDVFASVDAEWLRIVCTSRWLAAEARRSSVLRGKFRIEVVPGAVDTEVFRPLDREMARAVLGIPSDQRVLLFVAHDPRIWRKGFHLLYESLRSLPESEELLLLSLGRSAPKVPTRTRHQHLGFVGNDRLLAVVYSAADLFVIPSIQDNLPTTVLEAIACGTPVLGFDVGGIPDMVRPGISGRLVPEGDVHGLAAAATDMLADPAGLKRLGENARSLALSEYTLERQARDYEGIYREMLGAD